MRKVLVEFVPGLVGGAVGGYLGYLCVWYIMTHSTFWVPILPGAFAGLACGQLSWTSSRGRGVLNGILALFLAIYAQWKLFDPPFEFDKTFMSYLFHIHQLPWLTQFLLVVNGLIGFWWGSEAKIWGRSGNVPPSQDRGER